MWEEHAFSFPCSVKAYDAIWREARDLTTAAAKSARRRAARKDLPYQLVSIPRILRLKLNAERGNGVMRDEDFHRWWDDVIAGCYHEKHVRWHPQGGIDGDGGPAMLIGPPIRGRIAV